MARPEETLHLDYERQQRQAEDLEDFPELDIEPGDSVWDRARTMSNNEEIAELMAPILGMVMSGAGAASGAAAAPMAGTEGTQPALGPPPAPVQQFQDNPMGYASESAPAPVQHQPGQESPASPSVLMKKQEDVARESGSMMEAGYERASKAAEQLAVSIMRKFAPPEVEQDYNALAEMIATLQEKQQEIIDQFSPDEPRWGPGSGDSPTKDD